MALAILGSSTLKTTTTGEPEPVPILAPAPAPSYIPPVSEPIPPAPMIAPPPSGQFMGEGGTPFGSVPPIYLAPPAPADYGVAPLYGDPGTYNPLNGFSVPVLVKPPLKGEDAVVMPPLVKPPIKRPIASAVEPVKEPAPPRPSGPVSGTVLGFNLATVPLWVWIVAAVFVGAKVLR